MQKEKMKIVNVTPHSVRLIKSDGSAQNLPSEGIVRVSETIKTVSVIEGVSIIKKELTTVSKSDLERIKKEIDRGNMVLVSLLTAISIKEHNSEEIDLSKILIIGKTARDGNGRIIGATALTRGDLI